jgi:nicotinamidase-related amidase
MQNGFLNSHSESIIPNVLKLVEEFANRKVPIVFTTFRNTIGSPFERLMNWHNVRETPETDLHEAIRPFAEVVVEKQYYSVFTDEFDRMIREHGWETILICGVATESCVLKTAADAFERDLLPIVIANACGSDLGLAMHLNGLAVIEVMIGKDQIMTIDEMIRRLEAK